MATRNRSLRGRAPALPLPPQVPQQTDKSFCFFFQKEALFFFEKKNQKTFVRLRPLRWQR
jgi:hypothetical protein